MTKVLRFMSANEAIKLLRGERVHNHTNHRQNGNASDSVGFCFAVISLLDPELIYEHALYLSGITRMDVCLIGEVKDRTMFASGEARFKGGMRTELATQDYDLDDFVDWAMYTPQLSNGPYIFVPVSTNWVSPVLATKKGEK